MPDGFRPEPSERDRRSSSQRLSVPDNDADDNHDHDGDGDDGAINDKDTKPDDSDADPGVTMSPIVARWQVCRALNRDC